MLPPNSNYCYNISKRYGFFERIFTAPKNGNFYNAQNSGGINYSNLRFFQTVTCNCPSLNHCNSS